jgi:hypothetical protein
VRRQIINARVYDGIHFRIADEQGADLGEDVALYRREHYFQRVWRGHW